MNELNVTIVQNHDADYRVLEAIIRSRVASINNTPVFMTDAKFLWETFLNNIDVNVRQHYNCRACQKFIETYGGLAYIEEDGNKRSVLWDLKGIPTFFVKAVDALDRAIHTSRVRGVFYASTIDWGYFRTGDWSHLSGTFYGKIENSAYGKMAIRTQDYGLLSRALNEYSLEAAEQAYRVLEADVLLGDNVAKGVSAWFLDLHRRLKGVRGKSRENILWLEVATIPPGHAHVKNTMIGTLLDDIISGLPFEVIKKRWDDKMHPLKYQRPTALKEGNINAGERIINELGAEKSLERRFARRADITFRLWEQSAKVEETGGVFDKLRKTTGVKPVELPPKAITFEKLANDVLPNANKVEILLPNSRTMMVALTTAVHPESPNMLQWDNTVSYYVYVQGATPASFGVQANTWLNVPIITLTPAHWAGGFEHQEKGVIFIIDNAADTRNDESAIFPANLRNEYHEAKKAIEAYSKRTPLQGFTEQNAAGFLLRGVTAAKIRVNGLDLYEVIFK